VFADLRGTGASFGTLTAELGNKMIADVGSLADWIAAQPWSNGRVGVTGVSYSGDTAPEPVDGPHGEALLAQARAEHFHNANLVDMANAGVYRDYSRGPQSWTVAGVGDKIAAIEAGGVPILTFAGWLDAGTASAPLRRATRVTGLGKITLTVTGSAAPATAPSTPTWRTSGRTGASPTSPKASWT